MKAGYGKALRQHLSNLDLRQIVDFGELPVFADAATFPTIVLVRKQPPTDTPTTFAKINSLGFASLETAIQEHPVLIPQIRFKKENWQLTGEYQTAVFDKMKANSVSLHEYVNGAIQYGIKTGFNEAFVIDRTTRDRLIAKDSASAEVIKSFVVGENVRHYRIDFEEKYLIFARRGIEIQAYPVILRHLEKYKNRLMPGTSGGRKPGSYQWYEIQDAVDYYADFEKPKIIYPVIAKEPRFTIDRSGAYCNDKAFIIPFDDTYLLGLLNSRLIWFYLKSVCSVLGDEEKGGRLELRSIYLRDVPIAQPTPAQRDELSTLADQMLDLTNQLQVLTKQVIDLLQTNFALTKVTEKLQHWPTLDWPGLLAELQKQKIGVSPPKQMEWKPFSEEQRAKALSLQAERTITDRRIDKLVYALYGLTDAEIAVVER